MTASELSPGNSPWRRVPARTMLLAFALFWLSFLTVRLVNQLTDVITYIVIAAFFAIILTPPVDLIVRRMRMSRGWAALVVLLISTIALSGLMYLFIKPIADRIPEFTKTFPEYVERVKHCREDDPLRDRCPKGFVADVIHRFKLEGRLDQFGEQTARGVELLKENGTEIAGTVGRGLAGTLTVIVLLILMLLHGSEILNRFISPFNQQKQERLRKLGREGAHTVSSYMVGNLLISVICGTATLIMLTILDVPFKAALSLWSGFADLIPLVGATLGAIPAVLVAFLHSSRDGVVMIIFFVIYQQFENHVLQVTIMSRTVALDPLIVLISVLIGVQLLGMLGALIAIPVAGAIQVLVRDIVANSATNASTAANHEAGATPSINEQA